MISDARASSCGEEQNELPTATVLHGPPSLPFGGRLTRNQKTYVLRGGRTRTPTSPDPSRRGRLPHFVFVGAPAAAQLPLCCWRRRAAAHDGGRPHLAPIGLLVRSRKAAHAREEGGGGGGGATLTLGWERPREAAAAAAVTVCNLGHCTLLSGVTRKRGAEETSCVLILGPLCVCSRSSPHIITRLVSMGWRSRANSAGENATQLTMTHV